MAWSAVCNKKMSHAPGPKEKKKVPNHFIRAAPEGLISHTFAGSAFISFTSVWSKSEPTSNS